MRTLGLLTCLLLAGAANAATIVSPITIFDTGAGATPTGSVDPNWSLIWSGGVYPSTAYVVDTNGFPFNGSWITNYGPATRWIAPHPSYNAGQTDSAGYFTYTTTFYVPTGADLSTVLISGMLSSDNCTTDIQINGAGTGFSMQSLVPGSACIHTQYSFTIAGSAAILASSGSTSLFKTVSNFQPGANTISFKVYNIPGNWTQNPTGIIVDFQGATVHVNTNPTPEPATVALGLAGMLGLLWWRKQRCPGTN